MSTSLLQQSMENSLEKINNAAFKLLTPLNPKETYKKIVREAIKLVGADEGVIRLEEEGVLKAVFATSPYMIKMTPRKNGYVYTTFKTNKPLVIHAKEFKEFYPDIAAAGVISSIFVPLSYKRKAIGVLVIQSHKDKSFSNEELHHLKLFGTFASFAIRKAQLYDEVNTALEVRDLFISMAAHELRTPITAINGYTQLLKSKVTPETFPHYKWLEDLSWEVLRLTLLVNELLEINRVREGQFHYTFREQSLREIIRRAINNIQFIYPQRKIIVIDTDTEESDVIIADFDKLMQVLINILKNAARFSPPASKILISLHFTKFYCIISVVDQGKGVSKEDMKRIFEKYYKGKNTQEEGMGLGLYLAKNIIQQHHGKLVIISKENEGTTITIKLPRRKI